MKLQKILFKTFILIFLVETSNACIYCIPASCDTVLNCVMKKQRGTIEDRLDDLINAIKANTKQTEHQTLIIEQEVLSYNRLLERVKKESLSLKEAAFLSEKIKKSESLGNTLNTLKKGK